MQKRHRSSPHLKQFSRDNRQQQTYAERIFWYILRDRRLKGFKFRRQHVIGNYIADFACVERKLVIELDGCYHEADEVAQHDAERTAELQKSGFRALLSNIERVQTPEHT